MHISIIQDYYRFYTAMDSGDQVFATKATCELCNIMLKDSAHIQMFEAEWRNRKARRAGAPEVVPLYNMDDAQGAIELLIPCDYNKKISIDENLDVRFIDAGHLLGSSSIEMWIRENDEEVKMAFSGDIGIPVSRLLRIQNLSKKQIMLSWSLLMEIKTM